MCRNKEKKVVTTSLVLPGLLAKPGLQSCSSNQQWGHVFQSKERERERKVSRACSVRGGLDVCRLAAYLCHAYSFAIMSHAYPRCYCLFPVYCFRTHRHAICMAVCNYDFHAGARSVISTHMEAVWSRVLEVSAGGTT